MSGKWIRYLVSKFEAEKICEVMSLLAELNIPTAKKWRDHLEKMLDEHPEKVDWRTWVTWFERKNPRP